MQNNRIKKIIFHGEMAKKYGNSHKMLGNNPFILFQHLTKTHPSLREYILHNPLTLYDNDHGEIDWHHPVNKTLHVLPKLTGHSGAEVAIALAIVSIVVSVATLFMLPSPDNPPDAPSYMYSGAVNTVQQGGAVPLIFGLTRTGSTIISSGLYPEELQTYDIDIGLPIQNDHNDVYDPGRGFR